MRDAGPKRAAGRGAKPHAGGGTRLRRSLPVLAVAALLAVLLFIASVSSPQVTQVPLPRPTFSPPPLSQEDSGREPARPTGESGLEGLEGDPGENNTLLWIIIGVVVAVGVAGGVWLLLWGYFAMRGTTLRVHRGVMIESNPLPEPEELQAVVQASLDELDDDSTEPRRAVIACWLRLEQAAAAAGTGRQAADTPTDLVTRMLAQHHVSGGLLRRLAELYWRARYAPDGVDEAMRTEARSTLARLRNELSRRSAVPS